MAQTRLEILAVVALAALSLTAFADETVDLDVTRVALFSSGVGYFECQAEVTGDATAELKFRTDQINDIIKSMVVQDFDGGKVGVISYASRDPIEKTLRSFGVDLTGKPTLGQLLDQLRGEPVEITGARSKSGLIVGVEKSQILSPDGKTLQIIEQLTLLTDAGLEKLDFTNIGSIRLTNDKIDAELRKALATLATSHDADKKSVSLSFEGVGQRRVRVAYVLEAPIWKTSYRLVLSEEKKPFLQGWATVENATEEDWKNVQLSLVSGRPISFRMDLYTPLYVPRPIEQLELYASLRPPEYEGGFEPLRATAERSFDVTQGMDARGGRGGGMFGGGRGRGGEVLRMKAAAPVDARRPRRPPAWSSLGEEVAGLGLEESGVASVATAQEAGELFEYRIDTPVSIPRQHSAMLPIVNDRIEGEKVSIYNAATHPKHPLNGLELKNTTGLHLMQGPVTLFDGNIYAGDAKLPDLKPDEKRLIAYALDLSTEVLVKQKRVPDELVSLRIAKGMLWRQQKYVDNREYRIKNKDDELRTVLVEQAFSDDWKLVEPKEAYERTKHLLRFKVPAAAQETTSFRVRVERIAHHSVVLASVGLDQIRIYLRSSVITPAVKQALEKVVALRTELDDVKRRRLRLEKERGEEIAEQKRIRENLKTLDRQSDAYTRQLRQFDEVDARIAKLRDQIKTARDEEEQKYKTMENYLLNLNVE